MAGVAAAVEQKVAQLNPMNVAARPGEKPKTWGSKDLDPDVSPGDLVRKMDIQFRWTELHQTGRQLDVLRRVGDDICEDVIVALDIKPSDDPLVKLRAQWELPPEARHPAAAAFLDSVCGGQSWYDADGLRRGQELFRRHALCIGKILLHLGLVAGYGAYRINRVLASTRYLIGNEDDTYRRLMETQRCVIDIMRPGGMEPWTGIGWCTIMRVRFLHAKVRLRLRKSQNWDIDTWGVPINQEDLAGTLMAFSFNALMGLQAVVGHVSKRDSADYLMLWRHVGFLLGIQDEYNPCSSLQRCKAYTESILMHLIDPDDTSRQLAYHTLKSVAGKGELQWSWEKHAALARMLMGPQYAAKMDMPAIGLWDIAFHGFGFLGDAINARLTGVPIIGRWLVDAYWNRLDRSNAEALKGRPLSIYAQTHVGDERNVAAMPSKL
eukprot:TRINITY_DN43708_c0_g1_i1.p1 TRINITY_DN43708_c0_g1~~TRINITY_DN43708_c0_g1_i1.p1  ORF type:complete len:457 (+),score=148.79 TRINITY_DN43708_c0_g1_i1:64-1371(+)